MREYVCHTRFDDQDLPYLPYFLPLRPTAEERNQRREMLERAHKRKVRDLRKLAIDYRLTLPLVMPTLAQSLQQTLCAIAGRPQQGTECRL